MQHLAHCLAQLTGIAENIITIPFTNFTILISSHLTPFGPAIPCNCLQPPASSLLSFPPLSARFTSPFLISLTLSLGSQKLTLCTGHTELFSGLVKAALSSCSVLTSFVLFSWNALLLSYSTKSVLRSSLNPPLILHLFHCIAKFCLWNTFLSHIVSYISIYIDLSRYR